jgi:hypothetical protein
VAALPPKLVQFERFLIAGTWTVSFGAAMKRRDFLTLFGGAMVARPFAALAQQNATSGRPAKIGVLWHAGMSPQPWPFPRQAMRPVRSGVAASRGTATPPTWEGKGRRSGSCGIGRP